MRITCILIFLTSTIFGQDDFITFDFNINEIRWEVSPIKNLREDYSQELRKKLKIKTIKISVNGKRSLDSIFKNEKEEYASKYKYKFLNITHAQVSYTDYYNYDKDGIFTSYYQYPKCNCFTKKDSLKFLKNVANISYKDNQTIVKDYFSDNEISNQKTYENGFLIKELFVSELNYQVKDSANRIVREKKFYKYAYNKKGKLIKTFINDRLVISYDYKHKNKEYYSFYDRYTYNDTIHSQHNMNQITRDKNGNISESLYYVKGGADIMISYKFIYDFQNK